MAAVASLKQTPVKLPKIPVTHSGQIKSDGAADLAVESVLVAEPLQSRVPHSASLPVVRMSLNASPAKQKSEAAVTRSMTSVDMKELSTRGASRGERSELKSSWLKANDVKNPFKYTVEELHEIVQEKIFSGFHGLKYMFKSHTANGNGLVSREALHKILIGMCGYISRDLFDRYMKRLNLHHSQYVSFEMFISQFPDNEAVKKEWLKPIQQAKAAKEAISYPEQCYRNANTRRVVRKNVAPASFFMLFLKDFAKKRKFMPEFHMPEAVRQGKEEMLRVHLRRIITSLSGYDINEMEMDKLWLRFDTRGVGSVPCEDFYKVIGYSPAVDTSLIPARPSSQQTPHQKEASEEKCRPATDMGVVSLYEINEDRTVAAKSSPIKRANKIAKKLKKLNSVIEELIYNLSLPAVNLEAAFKEFDILSDNFVSKVDFRRVLNQFGFPIGALDLETFLTRNNLRVLNDLIEYKEFILRFTNREDFGMVSKVVNDSQHLFNKRPGERLAKEGSGIEGWTAEELEAGLVEYFMGSYIQLLLSLRNLDPKMNRLLSEDEVKPLLEKILTREFQRSEWKYLLSVVGLSKDGLIPYENLIAIINNRRPTWNETNKLGHQVIVIRRPATTVELERLRESQQEATMRTQLSPLDHLRSLDDISVAIRELLKTRFQALDFAYRQQDRKMTGRLDKGMLGRILREGGLDFQPKEIDKLWGTFALAPDGLYTWSKFCQRYISDTGKLQQANELEDLTCADEMKQVVGRPLVSQPATRAGATRAKITDPVLIKLRPQILSHYDSIESLFLSLDSEGRGHVSVDEAVETLKVLKIQISAEEKRHILQLFDLEQSSKFHYKPFLALYKSRATSRQRPTMSAFKTPATGVRPSARMLNNRLVQQLQGRVPEMRRQFKKSDPLGQGVLSMTDFKVCLEQLGVNCGGDDSFSEVTSQFDHSLKGQINYEDFSALCR